MFEVPRRKFLLGSLAALFSAPAIVRASSLMQIRGERFALQGDFLAPLAIDYTSSESLNYEYWVVMSGNVVKRTARELMSAPAGVYTPWLPGLDSNGNAAGFRAVSEHHNGLTAGVVNWADAEGRTGTKLSLYNLGDRLDADPIVRKLRSEQDALLREIRAKREFLASQERRETYKRSVERQARANNRAALLAANRSSYARWEAQNAELLAITRDRDTSSKVPPLAPAGQ